MQNPKERNFHIFYQLTSGMDPESKKQFYISDPENYNYLNMHGCYKVGSKKRISFLYKDWVVINYGDILTGSFLRNENLT